MLNNLSFSVIQFMYHTTLDCSKKLLKERTRPQKWAKQSGEDWMDRAPWYVKVRINYTLIESIKGWTVPQWRSIERIQWEMQQLRGHVYAEICWERWREKRVLLNGVIFCRCWLGRKRSKDVVDWKPKATSTLPHGRDINSFAHTLQNCALKQVEMHCKHT